MSIEREDLEHFSEQLAEKLQDKMTISLLPLVSKIDALDKIVAEHKELHNKVGGLDAKLEEALDAVKQVRWTVRIVSVLIGAWEALKQLLKV